MEKRPYYRRTAKRRYVRNHSSNSVQTTRLGNQMSAAVILCVFIIILAYTNSSKTQALKENVSAIVSKNALDNFEDKGNIKDNIYGFVKCMFFTEDTEKVEKEIADDNKISDDAGESSNESAKPEESPPV